MGKRNIICPLIAVIVILLVLLAVWYFSPRTFLEGVEAGDVTAISVFDGNTGNGFDIDDPEEIQAIVENIQSTPMKRDKISVNYSGFSFRMNFYGENGRVLDSFVVNSTDTIRSDPFFYCCDGGLCYDYLGELEAQYVN